MTNVAAELLVASVHLTEVSLHAPGVQELTAHLTLHFPLLAPTPQPP